MTLAEQPLPDLPPAAFWSLVGLALLLWVFARVQVLRRERARGDDGTTRLRLVHRLADWRGTYPLLALLGAGLVALLVTGL